MKELLLYIARSLVQHPDQVTVTEVETGDELTLELRVRQILLQSQRQSSIRKALSGFIYTGKRQLMLTVPNLSFLLADGSIGQQIHSPFKQM